MAQARYNKFGRFAISSSWTRLPDAQYAGMAVLQRSTGLRRTYAVTIVCGFNDGCCPLRWMQRKKADMARDDVLPYVRAAEYVHLGARFGGPDFASPAKGLSKRGISCAKASTSGRDAGLDCVHRIFALSFQARDLPDPGMYYDKN